jgi:hypothetical protein
MKYLATALIVVGLILAAHIAEYNEQKCLNLGNSADQCATLNN